MDLLNAYRAGRPALEAGPAEDCESRPLSPAQNHNPQPMKPPYVE